MDLPISMPTPSAEPDWEPDWEGARHDFEAGLRTRNEICQAYRIRRSVLDRRITSHRWGSAEIDLSDRQIIIQLLYAALERHARHLEGAQLTGTGDKEAAVLHKLVLSLDKLIRIEAKTSGKPGSRQGRELEELRGKIAKRLGELNVQ